MPHRQGWERLGSHEVVDDEIRTKDARHEALLKAVVNDAPAKKLEEIEKNQMNVESS